MKTEKTFCLSSPMVNQETIWIKVLLVVSSRILTTNSIMFLFVSLEKK